MDSNPTKKDFTQNTQEDTDNLNSRRLRHLKALRKTMTTSSTQEDSDNLKHQTILRQLKADKTTINVIQRDDFNLKN